MAITHRRLSAPGNSASPLSLCHCLCCYCDTASPPPSAPYCVPDLPLILEILRVRPCPDSGTGFQWSHFESSPRSALLCQPCMMLPHSPLCPLCWLGPQVLRCLWGLRDSRGCSYPGNRARSWGWSAGKEMGSLALWSWCMGLHRVPGQIQRTSPPGQQRPGSAVVNDKEEN